MYQRYARTYGEPDNVQVFRGSVSSGPVNNWFTWNKPANCHAIQIFIVAAGGGGGGGSASALSVAAGGGGGGGGGSTLSMTISAYNCPGQLFICAGDGGLGGKGQVQGGAAATAGTNSGPTYITTKENGTNSADYLYNFNTSTGGAVAQTAGSAGALNTGKLTGSLGLNFLSLAATAAGTGNATGSGSSVTPTSITSGGSGGAGVTSGNVTSVGGGITGAGITLPSYTGGAFGGGRGQDGYDFISNFGSYLDLSRYGYAGCGGGSNSAGTGGAGGNGATGCGGGGGGGTNGTGSTGGAGGNGGPGMVIITCW